MSYDALFQLGMGPVRLEAPQTEDACAMRGLKRRVRAFRARRPRTSSATALLVIADLLRSKQRGRGNCAKTGLRAGEPARILTA